MFRPCIDLRDGRVVQIVGGTLSDDPSLHAATTTHHVSDLPAEWFASRYRDDSLAGGHIIMLGAGNESSARRAVAAWPGGMQVGGGISVDNAHSWLNAGASHVIVTSWLFVNGELSSDRLAAMVAAVGRERLVIDLSCRRRDGAYWVVTDRWQRFTSLQVTADVLARLGESCAEFLVHGVDVEGLAQGIDLNLIALLAEAAPVPTTYAGGARSLDDLTTVDQLSGGRIDLTIGAALDLFGGHGVRYADCVEFNRRHQT